MYGEEPVKQVLRQGIILKDLDTHEVFVFLVSPIMTEMILC